VLAVFRLTRLDRIFLWVKPEEPAPDGTAPTEEPAAG